jgi:NAD(P)H-quinone oxidoreductase subunit 4L
MQLEYFLLVAAALFCIGVYGLVTSRNVIRVLMSIELMLNAVNLNLMAFSNYLDPVGVNGQVFAVFVISIAAAEAAVGLAIVLSIYRNRDTVDMEQFNLLKWEPGPSNLGFFRLVGEGHSFSLPLRLIWGRFRARMGAPLCNSIKSLLCTRRAIGSVSSGLKSVPTS